MIIITLPEHRCKSHFTDVRHPDRCAVATTVEDDVADVVERRHEAFASDQPLFGPVHDGTATSIAVVFLERREHAAQRDVVVEQLVRIDLDFIRLELAAERVHLDDAGHAAELERDLPVEDRSQVHETEVVARFRADLELVDLAHARGDGAHLRIAHTGRNVFPGLLEPLVDQVASPVDVRAFLEGDGYGREPEPADGANLGDARQPAHRVLDGERDELLDFYRAERRRRRQHLYLNVGEVGHRVQGQARDGDEADAHQHDRQEHHDEPITERPFNDAGDHDVSSIRRRGGWGA